MSKSIRFSGNSIAMIAVVSIAAISTSVRGQSALPALFVTDYIPTSPQFGNFASVRSFTVDTETGDLTPVGIYFTNDSPLKVSLSPNGRYLAVGHATDIEDEDLLIFRVNSDASLTMYAVITVMGNPYEFEWLNNNTMLVLETRLNDSALWTYDFNPDAPQAAKLTPIDVIETGLTSYDLALHPTRPFVFVPSTPALGGGINSVFSILIQPDRTLTEIQQINAAASALDLQVTPDGRFLYMVSGGGDTIQGFSINQQNGTLTPMAFSPFPTINGAVSDLQITADGAYLFVMHGAEDVVRSYSISPDDGIIFDTGFSYDFQDSGFTESIEIMGNLLFVTRNPLSTTGQLDGIRRFRIQNDGSFVPFGDTVPAGTRPYYMETWTPIPIVPGDINADGVANLFDIPAFVAALLGNPLEPGDIERADVNQDGDSNGLDMQLFIEAILFVPPTGACCSTQAQCVVATEAECLGMLFTNYLGDDSLCEDCPAIPAPTIDLVSPGGPLCNVPPLNLASFLIFGLNFATTADVVLVSNGQPDVQPTLLQVNDATFIAADFDLNGVAAGFYRIRVTNPDGQFVESLETFEVTACN